MLIKKIRIGLPQKNKKMRIKKIQSQLKKGREFSRILIQYINDAAKKKNY